MGDQFWPLGVIMNQYIKHLIFFSTECSQLKHVCLKGIRSNFTDLETLMVDMLLSMTDFHQQRVNNVSNFFFYFIFLIVN